MPIRPIGSFAIRGSNLRLYTQQNSLPYTIDNADKWTLAYGCESVNALNQVVLSYILPYNADVAIFTCLKSGFTSQLYRNFMRKSRNHKLRVFF